VSGDATRQTIAIFGVWVATHLLHTQHAAAQHAMGANGPRFGLACWVLQRRMLNPDGSKDRSMSEMAIFRQLRNSTVSNAIQNLPKLCRLNIRHIDAVDFVDLRNQMLVVIRAVKIR
jgi:hypothetical protein